MGHLLDNLYRPVSVISVIVVVSLLALLILKLTSQPEQLPSTLDEKLCYRLNTTVLDTFEISLDLFDDIMESKKKPTHDKSIFFHETSCVDDGLFRLNPRQACAIESAALMNPSTDIFVISVAHVGLSKDPAKIPRLITELQKYKNIHFRNIDYAKYLENTTFKGWESKIDAITEFFSYRAMDFLRFVTLYRFGGTFLDFDVIVQESLGNLVGNYVGADSNTSVNFDVLNVQSDGAGIRFAELCLKEFQKDFNGTIINKKNGPDIVMRALKELCYPIKELQQMSAERCLQFHIYPQNQFYAIPKVAWDWFFKPDKLNRTLAMTKDSKVVHVWDEISNKRKLSTGIQTAYSVIANKQCPNVFLTLDENF